MKKKLNSTLQPKTVRLLTEQSLHWYESPRKKGIYYPSVTTINAVYPKGIGFNKYLTEQSSWQSAQEQLEEAGLRGTKVHQGTELLEKRQTLYQEDYQIEEWQRLIGFVNWFNEYQPKLLLSEHKMVSDKYRIGGTIDRLYEIDGKIGIVDIKTGKKIYNNYWVQVAAYEKLITEKKIIISGKPLPKIDFLAVLRLTPLRKTYFEYVEMTDWKESWEAFQACQRIWTYENGKDAQPKILELPMDLKLDIKV